MSWASPWSAPRWWRPPPSVLPVPPGSPPPSGPGWTSCARTGGRTGAGSRRWICGNGSADCGSGARASSAASTGWMTTPPSTTPAETHAVSEHSLAAGGRHPGVELGDRRPRVDGLAGDRELLAEALADVLLGTGVIVGEL